MRRACRADGWRSVASPVSSVLAEGSLAAPEASAVASSRPSRASRCALSRRSKPPQLFVSRVPRRTSEKPAMTPEGPGGPGRRKRLYPPCPLRYGCTSGGAGVARGEGEGSVYMALVNARSEAGRGTAPEVYANELAGNVLMPADEVRACTAQGMDTIAMAAYFGVSLSAMSYRREVLGE